MKIILDEGVRKELTRSLPGHQVTTVPDAGWASVPTMNGSVTTSKDSLFHEGGANGFVSGMLAPASDGA